MEQYPSNSLAFRKEQTEVEERKKLDKIITGTVKTKKKSGAEKFFKEVLSENFKKAKDYVVKDIIVPGVKNAITKTIDVIIWGDDRRPSGTKVSYRSYYDQPYGGVSRSSRNYEVPQTRVSFTYEDVIFENRGEAEHVLSQLDDMIGTYGMVSVADLYDLVGMSCDYTYNKYGWTNIRNARIERVRDGYLLEMPKALPIK